LEAAELFGSGRFGAAGGSMGIKASAGGSDYLGAEQIAIYSPRARDRSEGFSARSK
jgi:hypothetical protein